MRIRGVRATTIRIPLGAPVLVGGGLRIAEREYVLAVVESDDGHAGVGWSYTRGGDVAGAVQRLAPVLVGHDALAVAPLWARMDALAAAEHRPAALARAMSALDIALWDLNGHLAGRPLYALLGGHQVDVPVLMAGMYCAEGRRPDDDAREAEAYAEQGYGFMKMMGGVFSPEEDRRRLRAVRGAVGHDVALGFDVNGAWRDTATALAHARALEDLNLAFVEEPLPPEDRAGVRALAERSPIPIAVGETAMSGETFTDLAVAPLILRPDATVVGGVTAWIGVHRLATATRRQIIPHYFPYVHIHLAAGLPDVGAVECVTTAGDVSNFHRIVRAPLRPDRGTLRPPDGPGLGVEIDWDAVARYTVH